MSTRFNPAAKSPSISARWVLGLSTLNLAALTTLWWLLHSVSEGWWVSTVLTYAPRTPFLAPTLGLMVAALFWHRPSNWLNATSLVVVLIPVMGLSVPTKWLLGENPPADGTFELKVVSCNVQAFRPNFSKVLEEINAIRPDVIALQEAFPVSPLLEEAYRDWHSVRYDRYWVGSRFPLKVIGKCEIETFERSAGMIVQIETPAGPIVLGDIHQMTARWGLRELSRGSLLTGEGPRRLEEHEVKREEESLIIREQIESVRGSNPLIVVGDFNTPASSQLFRRHWGDFQSAFDQAGFGYGYTSPCKSTSFWPENLPWVRIDHILCSPEWSVRSCQIGHSAGSDHRLIAAKLVLTSPAGLMSEDAVAGLR